MSTQEALPTVPKYSFPIELTKRAADGLHCSNNVLSQVELTDVRNQITKASLKIAEFESGMEQLDVLRSEYEKGRNECVAFIKDHQHLLSSIRSVPPEIWREVFIHAQRQHDAMSYGQYPSHSFYLRAPQLCGYGAVSSLWRKVTLDTPALWSTISTGRRFSPTAILLLDHWLSRSKNHPLKIAINTGILDNDSFNRVCDVRHLLNNQAHRWREIHITADWDFIQNWPTIAEQTSLLEKCSFNLDTWIADADIASFITDAPRLKTVRLDQSSIGDPVDVPPLVQWSLVSAFKLSGFFNYPEDFQVLMILKQCPLLEEFELRPDNEDDDEEELGNFEPVQLGHLKSLSISGIPRLLGFLIAPLLTSLRIDSCPKAEHSAFISDFVKRSPCLTDLTIEGGYHIVVPRLQSDNASQIRMLTLKGFCSNWADISKTVFALCNAHILPELQSLAVVVHCLKTVQDNTVKDAFSVRDAVLTLCRLRLNANMGSARTLNHIRNITIKFNVSQLESDLLKVETDAFRGLRDMALEGLFVDIAIN